jgi:hypothetical protein
LQKILNLFFKILFLSIFFASAKVMASDESEQWLHNEHGRPLSGCNVVYYSQVDPVWGNASVGSFSLRDTGCGITSIAMIMSSYGALYSPLEWAQRLHEAGFFNVGDQRSFQPGAEEYAASLAGLTPILLDTQDKLIDFLKTGHPVYAVCFFEEFASPSPHAVVLQGFDNGQTFVSDPAGAGGITGVNDISHLWSIRRGKHFGLEDKYPDYQSRYPDFYGFSGAPLYTAVYRLYQPRAILVGNSNDPYDYDNYIGLHHYTTNVYEVNQLVVNRGWEYGWDWNYEQVAFLDKGEIWLYRVYNPNDGNHLFTMNSHEKDELTALGWHDEGVGWRVSMTGKPVYRIYNPGSGEHIYTLNYEEVKAAEAAGMIDEGIAWWC